MTNAPRNIHHPSRSGDSAPDRVRQKPTHSQQRSSGARIVQRLAAGIAQRYSFFAAVTHLAKLRIRAFHAQQGRCIYCGLPMWESCVQEAIPSHIPERLARHLRSTAEHLIARQDGGPNCAINIAAACAWCNIRRHAHRAANAPDPVKYQQQVQRLMKRGHWHPAGRFFLT